MVDDKMNESTENTKKVDSKEKVKNFSTSETIVLVVVSLLVGISIGLLYNRNKISTPAEAKTDEYLEEFIRNYEYILDNYYEEIDKSSLINNAIAGMMESLDDYSVYIDESESSNFSITLNGSYEGIGVQIAKDEDTGYIVVTGVIKDSPAQQAGLKVYDSIVSVNGKSVSEMSSSEFSQMVRNSEEKDFKFEIIRDEEKLEVNLTRKIVTLQSVSSEIYEEDGKKIGYIYIGIFANNTLEQFRKNLIDLESKKIDYLIIDVRGNTGGHLTSVDGMLDLFLNKDQIMYQFEQAGKVIPTYGSGNDKKEYEIILLGDEGSASASEVLIAGLRENLNCKFFGKKTYGKGTVQELVTLSNGTQYKITTKKWLTPKGNWINDTEGITPDEEVELDSLYYETLDEKDDTQLQAAINYIKSK